MMWLLAVLALPPQTLDRADVAERLGQPVPLELRLTDHAGQTRRLGDLLAGRPVALTLVYYRCPMLCNLVLGGLARGLHMVDWRLGSEYDAITVSIDPTDDAAAAAQKRAGYLQALGLPGSSAWPFLTADAATVRALADSVGFRYERDPATGDFAHTAVMIVLSPEGRVSRYLYGIDFPPRQLKLALGEAAAGKVGSTLDRVLLRCYRYDPATRRYGLFVARFFRAGGLLVLAALGGFVGRAWLRERRRKGASD